ncbi:twin-arginine translocation signal domain-containing protein [Bacteroidota bacterium]
MKKQMISRRSFLKTNAAGLAGVAVGGTFFNAGSVSQPLEIYKPFHGAILNRRHGEVTTDGLKYRVRGRAPLKDSVTVNNTPVQREGFDFFC